MIAVGILCGLVTLFAYPEIDGPDTMNDEQLFEAAFEHTLANEGTKLTHDPRDLGGLTAYGITQRSYSVYLGRQASGLDMAAIDKAIARDFYHKIFWLPLRSRLPDAPGPTVLAIFDVAVNCGAATAVALAQTAVGGVHVDGKLGPLSAAAIARLAPPDFLQAFVPQVVARYARIAAVNPTQMAFLDGWVHRAMRLYQLLPAASAVA